MLTKAERISNPEIAFQPENLKQAETVRVLVWRQALSGPEFLLLKLNQAEADAQDRGIEWHPAGGRKDDHEKTDQQTGLREVFEETQLTAADLWFGALIHQDAWLGYYDGEPGYQFNANFYECEYTGQDGELQLSREHDAYGWFGLDELPDGTTSEALAAITNFMQPQENAHG